MIDVKPAVGWYVDRRDALTGENTLTRVEFLVFGAVQGGVTVLPVCLVDGALMVVPGKLTRKKPLAELKKNGFEV